MAQADTVQNASLGSSGIGIRKIHVSDLWRALLEGFDDFRAKPSHLFFLCVIYPLFALILTLFLVGENLIYLVFPIVAGFTLLGPVVSVALFELSRRRESGLEASWGAAFGFIHSASFAPIMALSVLMTVLYVAWLFLAQFIYLGLFGAVPPDSVADFITQVLTTRRGGALIFYGTGVGFLFALAALAISVVAFPMLLDRPVSAVTAVKTSIRSVAANPFTMALWGLLVVALLAAGALLFLIGLAVVLPVLGHATWHLYRKLVAS